MARGEPSKIVEGWTKSRYWSFIRSGLRRCWMKYPLKFEVANAGREKRHNDKGRLVWHNKCAGCGKWFEQKYLTVDHIVPCGSLKDFKDLPAFVEKLFCGVDKLQILCNYKLADKDKFGGEPACHYKKSQEERKKK